MGHIYQSHDVFVPGKVSEITYVHREDRAAENGLATEARRGGKIVSVVGPTKMGKTVLVGKIIQDSLWLEGQWLRSLDDFWTKLAVELNLPTSKSGSTTTGDTAKWSIMAKLGFPGVGGASTSVAGDHKLEKAQSWSTNIPQDQAVTRALKELSAAGRKHSIVIDDFHFVPAAVRTEIIQNLKPLTYAGIPAMLITLPHRRRDSIAGVEDIGGRTRTISVKAWLESELIQIAQKGFDALKVLDPDNKLAQQLARESYGSPELMQSGCDRFIWPRQDGYFWPPFMTRRAPVAVICGPTFNVGFITGWMRRKAGLDGVESGVVRADSKGRPG